jgi:hypothetical protein
VHAKFFQRYRLFFRFDLKAKIIVYALVNDEDSKRAYGSKNDAYAVFKAMLVVGNPPSAWADLKGMRDGGWTPQGGREAVPQGPFHQGPQSGSLGHLAANFLLACERHQRSTKSRSQHLQRCPRVGT